MWGKEAISKRSAFGGALFRSSSTEVNELLEHGVQKGQKTASVRNQIIQQLSLGLSTSSVAVFGYVNLFNGCIFFYSERGDRTIDHRSIIHRINGNSEGSIN
jgi:hypothetical protein